MLVAGLISGTSADGIDVALVEIAGAGFRMRVRPLAHCSFPYPPRVRAAVLEVAELSACANPGRGRLCKRGPDRVANLNFLLGELFAEAVVRACNEAKMPLARVLLIGSHGQTVFHQGKPRKFLGRSIASTLQIGEPAVIAARTGIDVVADFRPGDIAAGGEGAPLVPYVDYLLYRSRRVPRIALNIGGIANITIIPAGAAPEQVAAFDTGPGNMIIDALASRFTGGRLRYDRDGMMAAAGRVDRKLLDNLLAGAYFRRPPPKSAGREQYGAEFVERLLRSGLAAEDLMATATAFTAESIALGIRRFSGGAITAARKPPTELIVSGGGLRNPQLMAQLVAALPQMRIRTSNDFGIDSDAKEAIAFAVLAYETYHRRPSNLPSATGARRPAVLGKLVFGGGRR